MHDAAAELLSEEVPYLDRLLCDGRTPEVPGPSIPEYLECQATRARQANLCGLAFVLSECAQLCRDGQREVAFRSLLAYRSAVWDVAYPAERLFKLDRALQAARECLEAVDASGLLAGPTLIYVRETQALVETLR